MPSNDDYSLAAHALGLAGLQGSTIAVDSDGWPIVAIKVPKDHDIRTTMLRHGHNTLPDGEFSATVYMGHGGAFAIIHDLSQKDFALLQQQLELMERCIRKMVDYDNRVSAEERVPSVEDYNTLADEAEYCLERLNEMRDEAK